MSEERVRQFEAAVWEVAFGQAQALEISPRDIVTALHSLGDDLLRSITGPGGYANPYEQGKRLAECSLKEALTEEAKNVE